jgi:hypothetical protein
MNQATPEQRAQWRGQGLKLDEVSGYPIGTLIQNAQGEYGVILQGGVVRKLSADEAEEYKQSLGQKQTAGRQIAYSGRLVLPD